MDACAWSGDSPRGDASRRHFLSATCSSDGESVRAYKRKNACACCASASDADHGTSASSQCTNSPLHVFAHA
eukprot:5233566-Pyramimonas_sp.AAC.1